MIEGGAATPSKRFVPWEEPDYALSIGKQSKDLAALHQEPAAMVRATESKVDKNAPDVESVDADVAARAALFASPEARKMREHDAVVSTMLAATLVESVNVVKSYTGRGLRLTDEHLDLLGQLSEMARMHKPM